MRILYFHQHFSTPEGSTATRSYEIVTRLAAIGHQVTIVCGSYSGSVTGLASGFTRGKRQGNVGAFRVIEFDLAYTNADGLLKRTITFLKYVFRSLFIAMTSPCDLVFATSTPLTVAIPGILARWLRRKPFIFEVRDLWPELPKAMGVITNPIVLWAMSCLEWLAYHSADRLVALSPGMVDGIANRGIDRRRIIMVPNGADIDLFGASASPAWRPPGVDSAALLVLFAGTHGLANGLDAVLDAASVLSSRGRNDIKIALIGDGKYKPHLQARAATENLTNVVFHAPLSKTSLSGVMAAADICLQTLKDVPAFYYGTSPNKFFDALAAGKPVLTNYPGWIAEIITENKCGYAVPPGDPVRFANALEHAADHRSELQVMGIHAREAAQRDFDRTKLITKLIEAIEDVGLNHSKAALG